MRILNTILMTAAFYILISMRVSETPVQDTEFVQYVDSLCSELEHKGHSCRLIRTVAIRKASIPKKLAGTYHPLSHDIIISKEVWDKSSGPTKEQLIFHELGHSLGLDHVEYGIMQSGGFINDEFYTRHRKIFINSMLDELVLRPKEKQVDKNEILDNEHAVVRFTATWCPPCKALAPIFDEVAAENPNVKVYVIDVDQVQGLASEFGIRGIPALVKIKGKKVETTLVGMQSKEKVEELFK